MILQKLEKYAAACGARNGSQGLWVEDAAGGSVLIQQAKAKGWQVRAIPAKLMMKGKDERAMLAGGPAFRRECKVSKFAFDKVVEWKGRSMNHLMRQVTSFRMADPDAYKRADDLMDCATYSIALVLADATAIA